MAEIGRTSLFGKLNPLAYKAIESATTLCQLRHNPYVELAHWLSQILQQQDSDLHRIVQAFEIDPGRLAQDVTAALDRLPRGATSITDFSSHVMDTVERGWVYASLLYRDNQVRTGYLLLGAIKTPHLKRVLSGISREFDRIGADVLSDRLRQLVAGSPEEALAPTDGTRLGAGGDGASAAGDGAAPAAMGREDALGRFTTDLTQRARDGKLDPIVGRDAEIRQVVDILMRRRQNNPILTGEAGVGKTAVVEGFAQRIVRGDVPPALKDVRLLVLDVGLLQAGAGVRGEFENRLRQVIEEVQASPKPIVLFIDEAHTLVGAGGAAGTGDAANLLKPALARGTLRTVAATTWSEYKRHIEKDPALTRRFQVVQVAEPTTALGLQMMRGVAATLERHHGVTILDEALAAAVSLSQRYIPARQLPDKSVSLLDTAAARVAISQHAVPAEVDDARRRIEALETELGIIGREEAVGIDAGDRRTTAETALAGERERLAALDARWAEEKALVERILGLRAKLRGDEEANGAEPPAEIDRAALLTELKAAQAELAIKQGDRPLIQPGVDHHAVAQIVAEWTGIPVGRMVANEIDAVLGLDRSLARRVIGQDHAMQMIARRVQTTRARLDNPTKPVGVFLLCGPSGVGKTETALALAETLYGGEQNLITINMSEFQEAHTVSTLKGAPPGYVGYGEGGVLTEAVRRRPYSVVLLDEVEKAHPDVHEIFFQVFDKGQMEDGEGRLIDFRNTLILLTSNVGSDLIINLCRDPELTPEPEAIAKALREPLLKVFPAALLGRLVVIPYYPLSDTMLRSIVRLQLGRIERRMAENHRSRLSVDDAVVDLIVSRCEELESGGRMIDAILTNTMLPAISQAVLEKLRDGGGVGDVRVGVENGDFKYEFG